MITKESDYGDIEKEMKIDTEYDAPKESWVSCAQVEGIEDYGPMAFVEYGEEEEIEEMEKLCKACLRAFITGYFAGKRRTK